MRAYIVKRLLLIPVTIFGITFITFGVMKLAPGDPSQLVRGQASGGNVQATQANIESLNEWKKERHLDRHWVVQYGFWLRDLCNGDHGRSFLPPHLVGRGMTLFNIGTMGGTFVVQLLSGVLIDLFPAPGSVYPLDAYRAVFAAQALGVLLACGAYGMGVAVRQPSRTD